MEVVLGGSGSLRRCLGGHMEAVLEAFISILSFQSSSLGDGLAPEASFEGCLERNHCPGGSQGDAV